MIPTRTKKQDSSQKGEEVVALHQAIASVEIVSQTQPEQGSLLLTSGDVRLMTESGI